MNGILTLYRKLGFSIIPLRFKSKEPLIQWLEFQERKPTDDELKRWFSNGSVNVAVVCGSISGNPAVLDFDSLDAFQRFFGKTPEELAEETLVVKTARGYHVYFRSAKALRTFKIPELNMEVKGDGSYVAAPPSIHPSGSTYEFIGDPFKLKEIPVIEELGFFIWTRAAELGVFKHGTNEDPPCIRIILNGVGEGMRNESAVRLVSYWLYFKRLTADEALNKLMEWNSRNRPPLDEKELRNCLSSILKHGYEYGCSSMVELGVCNDKLKAFCGIKGKLNVSEKPDWLIDEELAGEPLTVEEVKKILGTTVKRDDDNKIICFLVMLLTYTEEDQINLGFLAGSSTGKSYIPIELAQYFPTDDVVKLGYASPTAFFHELGEVEEEPFTKRKIIHINLRRKILIFLDQPHDQLLMRLRSLLSHDEKEIMFKITDKREKAGLRTKTVIVHGFPTVIFCTAKFELEEQEKTRLLLLSPEVSQEKLRESIFLKIERESD